MDTSKEYIEMCRTCNLHTDDYVYRDGSLFFNTTYIYKPIITIAWTGTWKDKPSHLIPLWQQDQLQEMVTDKKSDQKNCKLWYSFKKYITDIILNSDGSVLDLPSWEQLWLAFVMEKKFNKTWDGSDWVIKSLTT